jgi:hypothetical protein
MIKAPFPYHHLAPRAFGGDRQIKAGGMLHLFAKLFNQVIPFLSVNRNTPDPAKNPTERK